MLRLPWKLAIRLQTHFDKHRKYLVLHFGTHGPVMYHGYFKEWSSTGALWDIDGGTSRNPRRADWYIEDVISIPDNTQRQEAAPKFDLGALASPDPKKTVKDPHRPASIMTKGGAIAMRSEFMYPDEDG